MSGDTFSFVLRIWSEAVDDCGNITVWRGSIEHVGAGERTYFCDLDAATRYILRQTGLDAHAATSSNGPSASERGRP